MTLRIAREGACAVWTMARPETRNALDHATLVALTEACAEAEADDSVRAVVLVGEGSVFASGGDLRELRDATGAADGERLLDAGLRVTAALAALPVPVIAALTGPAIGGGAELAIACDVRVAEAGARLCFKQGRMAVTAAWGSMPRLVGLVGPGAAARLLFTGHDVSGAEAHALGLVEGLCEDGHGLETALAWARDIARSAPAAVAQIKRFLRRIEAFTPPGMGEDERRTFVALWASPDHAEAVTAYFERRPAVFGPRSVAGKGAETGPETGPARR